MENTAVARYIAGAVVCIGFISVIARFHLKMSEFVHAVGSPALAHPRTTDGGFQRPKRTGSLMSRYWHHCSFDAYHRTKLRQEEVKKRISDASRDMQRNNVNPMNPEVSAM